MIRQICILMALICLSSPLAAQEPLVDVQFDENKAIPGQPLLFRITVLVPTWMPKPVVFPSFEAPNILVQLPEGATNPTSRDVDGETWSGVSRRLQITPMVPGRFQIQSQELIITWAEPGQTDPKQATVALDPIVVEGIIPEGAGDLDPFLAANGLKLESEHSEQDMPMNAGDSLTFSVTATIEGSPSMFLPPLIPAVQIEGVAAYPAEPVLSDSENRGIVTGTRAESVSLVAQSGGSGRVPEFVLRWYNLQTKEVEEARVAGFDVSVDAPKAATRRLPPQMIAAYALLAVFAAGLMRLLWVFLTPPLRTWRATRRAQYESSEAWAYAQVRDSVAARDMGQLLQGLGIWATRTTFDPRDKEPLKSALSALGAARYGSEKAQEDTAWHEVERALPDIWNAARQSRMHTAQLPPLNPIAAATDHSRA
ncbi:MAG: hypothetical protein AAF665_09585 [Pseudomonadota bacterium]